MKCNTCTRITIWERCRAVWTADCLTKRYRSDRRLYGQTLAVGAILALTTICQPSALAQDAFDLTPPPLPKLPVAQHTFGVQSPVRILQAGPVYSLSGPMAPVQFLQAPKEGGVSSTPSGGLRIITPSHLPNGQGEASGGRLAPNIRVLRIGDPGSMVEPAGQHDLAHPKVQKIVQFSIGGF